MSTINAAIIPLSVLQRGRSGFLIPPPSKLQSCQKRKAIELEVDAKAANNEGERIAKEVKIVPDADVLLKVGNGAKALDIRVSSSAISTASDVFCAMLSSPFWQEARSQEIELYEDDPDVVLAFCNIVHHKWGDVKLQDAKLVNLAAFADMRLCAEYLKPWFKSKLGLYMKNIRDISRVLDGGFHPRQDLDGAACPAEGIMDVAATFGLYGLFWDESRVYLYSGWHDLEELSFNPGKLVADVGICEGFSVYNVLSSARKEIYADLTSDIYTCIGTGFVDTSLGIKKACSQERYGAFSIALALILEKPRYFWPYGQFPEVARCIRALADPDQDPVLVRSILKDKASLLEPRVDLGCSYCKRDILVDLVQVVDRHIKHIPGVDLQTFMRDGEGCLTTVRPSDKP